MHFLGGPTLPPSSRVLWFWSHGRHKTYFKQGFFACWFHFQCFYLNLAKAKHRTYPYRDGETKWRFCLVAIFTWECCHSKERQKKLGWDTFLLEIGDLTKSALFGRAYPPPLKYSSMILVPREAQNLLQTRFFCMLIPFSMFLYESGEGKAPNSPL